MVTLRAALRDDMATSEIRHLCDRIETDVRTAVPDVIEFFIDPTGRAPAR